MLLCIDRSEMTGLQAHPRERTSNLIPSGYYFKQRDSAEELAVIPIWIVSLEMEWKGYILFFSCDLQKIHCGAIQLQCVPQSYGPWIGVSFSGELI